LSVQGRAPALDPTTVPAPSGRGDIDRFAEQARAAGLVVPRGAKLNPWVAIAVGALLVVAAVEVGYVAHGFYLQRTEGPPSPILPVCTDTMIPFNGTFSSTLDPSPVPWLTAADRQMASATGGCSQLTFNASSGDGYTPELAALNTSYTVSGELPNATDLAALPYAVEAIPVALAAVAVVYNLPGVPAGLNLSGAALAGIFSGAITSWDNSTIAALNPTASLGGLPPIEVVYRSDPTTSTQVFSEFLSDSSPAWSSSVGSGLSVAWPVGTATTSRSAELANVSSTPGAIGYVETFGSDTPGVEEAAVQDAAGGSVLPTENSVWTAAESFSTSTTLESGAWANLSFVNATAAGSYPLAQLVFVGVYHDLGVAYGGALSLTTSTWVLTFLWWLTGVPLLAPLPPAYIEGAGELFANVTYNGAQILHWQGPGDGDGDIDDF
jgi:phosphate transport system substrate-binding protein